MKKIGVIGLGNPLRGDDGVGIVLIKRLQMQKKHFPKNICFFDGGTGGMNLIHLLAKFECVLIIDAVDFQGHPAEVRVFGLDAILSKKKQMKTSTHDPDFINVLRVSKELKELPETLVLFGVQPHDVSHGLGLSRGIESALDEVYLKLQKEIQVLTK
jgi:hydrogenase maturation protease